MLKHPSRTRPIGNRRFASARVSRGITIVELLIGVAIGLFILVGVSELFVRNITNSRRILVEARINQDLRSTMDLITRDLRRAAYWGDAINGIQASGANSATMVNPYNVVTPTGTNQISYAYSRDATENNVLNSSTEQFGFRLDTTNHAIQMYVGDAWQTITNTDILSIPNGGFTITPVETSVDIRAACAKTCVDAILPPAVPTAADNCPRIQVRTYNIVLTGNSKSDLAVSRTLRSQVRVRNDALAGSCPA